MHTKSWFLTFITLSTLLIVVIGAINYIVDPFSVTQKNILNIPVKLVSDDRSEKVIAINNLERIDNVMLGSSRVYLINPLVLSKYAGGITYNLGVGTAQAEDFLGFLLHLEKINKFPKVVVLGLDFYSFNDALVTNKYFVRNKTINFLNENIYRVDDIGEFVSWDTTGASIKTLKTFLGVKSEKQRFDMYGASGEASSIFGFYPDNEEYIDIYARDKQRKATNFLNNPPYLSVSKKRFEYLKKIVDMCKQHGTELKVFITPLYGKLQDEIYANETLRQKMIEFKNELRKITSYYDFLTYNDITRSSASFADTSHLKTVTGNLILARLYNDKEVKVPEGFGVYREMQAPQSEKQ
ncbi:MAG: hypothetical protein OEY66_10910 [Gammaproteobacteria bacterium]|nr:hypothetical protein [Gammaproteobacteria bacterium]